MADSAPWSWPGVCPSIKINLYTGKAPCDFFLIVFQILVELDTLKIEGQCTAMRPSKRSNLVKVEQIILARAGMANDQSSTTLFFDEQWTDH